MPWKYNGQTIKPGKPWTDDNGITHPSNWNIWSDSFKTQVGLVWEEPAQPQIFDKRFYWSYNNPKSIEDTPQVDEAGQPLLDENGNQIIQKGLKSEWIKKTKETAHALLYPTDWYELRKLTKAIDIPADILAYRDAVIQTANNIEVLINNTTTIEEFISLFESVVDSNNNVVSGPVIHNWPTSQ